MTLEKDTLLHRRYRIVEILGQGGMGSVYRAVDENLGTAVAVKENLFTTDEYARQFRLEAVILANLRHPNLPRVSDHFVMGEQGQYLVMDFIEGEDLRQRMERMGTITEDDAVQIGAAICDALDYLHSRKPSILHRDIKPGNVKITPDGHIYLVDFGLAKVVQGGQATTTGARAMTPGYSPPEQYGTARTDPRTDIYSLGATLYAALTSVIPEDGLARAMDNAQLTPLRKRNPKVSRRLAAAIEKAMAVDPSDRFQTAEEFKKALLGAKSITQQLTGNYSVAPPPPESLTVRDFPKSQPDSEFKPKNNGIVPPSTPLDEQPFMSPLKRQKERARQRRRSIIRFLLLLLILILGSVPFLAPDLLPGNIRGMIPFLAPTHTPTITPSPLPAATFTVSPTVTKPLPTATFTRTKIPTLTPSFTPTKTPLLILTETLIVLTPSTPQTPTITPMPSATPLGGGYGQIAFALKKEDVAQIYLVDVNGGEPVQITNMPDGACQPAWSPDGSRLAFISPCRGIEDIYYNTSIFTMNVDGTDLQQISTAPGGDFEPAWSPDGTKIAFTSLRGGDMEIYAINLEDQVVTQLTDRASQEQSRQPAWSPDGTQIVYVVVRFGVNQIWLMTADGEDEKQIVRSGTALTDYLPTWSRDGQLILFNQRSSTTFTLPYIMSISGVDRTKEQGLRVAQNVQPVENVEYSPDGYWLVYEGGSRNIYYMTVTGASRTEINTGGGSAFDPTWRPIQIP